MPTRHWAIYFLFLHVQIFYKNCRRSNQKGAPLSHSIRNINQRNLNIFGKVLERTLDEIRATVAPKPKTDQDLSKNV